MVRVWSVPLCCATSAAQRLSALLDPGEAARAARLATLEEHRRFVVSRGMLRVMLSAFNGQDPRSIRFRTGPRGKPSLTDGGPHFSLSHTSDMTLVAVTSDGPVGVDVERIRGDLGIEVFARELLSPPEVARIEVLPPHRRIRAWFQAWTRLEAVAKASGEGLRDDVGNCPARHAAFRTLDLSLDARHVGAVAAAPRNDTVAFEAFSDVPSAISRFGLA